jgi:hypothetical protein
MLNADPAPPWMAATSPTVLLLLLFYCPIPKIVAKYSSTRIASVIFFVLKSAVVKNHRQTDLVYVHFCVCSVMVYVPDIPSGVCSVLV